MLRRSTGLFFGCTGVQTWVSAVCRFADGEQLSCSQLVLSPSGGSPSTYMGDQQGSFDMSNPVEVTTKVMPLILRGAVARRENRSLRSRVVFRMVQWIRAASD